MALFAREDRYDAQVWAAASRYQVPPGLIKAVIAAESSFEPDAERVEDFTGRSPPSDWPAGVTKDASRGLMQLLCWRARTLGFEGGCDTALYEPGTNIDLGTKLLAINYAILGSWSDAVSAYNGGVRPHLGYGRRLADGEYRNQAYVDRVLGYWRYFRTGEPPPPTGAARPVVPLALIVGGVLALLPFLVAAVSGVLQDGAGQPVPWANSTGLVGIAAAVAVLWWRARALERRVGKIEAFIYETGGHRGEEE
jgi:hypothetical protein